jgi:hypothetical protein
MMRFALPCIGTIYAFLVMCSTSYAAQFTITTFKATKKYSPINGYYMGDTVTWDYNMTWSTSGIQGVSKCAVWYSSSQTYGSDVFPPRFYSVSPASDASSKQFNPSPAYRLDIYVADPGGGSREPIIYDPKISITNPI